ncbi:hypothetical protein P7C73_g4471, partial [Tremellales sp. Uapishka_1]
MTDALEQAALSGALFQVRSHSPARSTSTVSVANTDDDLGSDLSRPSSPMATKGAPLGHDGPQTGPKGVLEDKKAQGRHERSERALQHAAVLAEQERRKMVAMTVAEENAERAREKLAEEEESKEDAEARAKWRRARREELEKQKSQEPSRTGKRGGLKEVGGEGFVLAVERPGWVVVLVYEPYIPRCQDILASVLHLSLNLPPASSLPTPLLLLRARATSLSFSMLPATTASTPVDDENLDETGARPDPDVLPSLLAYRDGELEKTWIRVDWEVSEDGVEGLLRRAGILPPSHRLVFDPQTRVEDADHEDD